MMHCSISITTYMIVNALYICKMNQHFYNRNGVRDAMYWSLITKTKICNVGVAYLYNISVINVKFNFNKLKVTTINIGRFILYYGWPVFETNAR
jgi:hypothetical protein